MTTDTPRTDALDAELGVTNNRSGDTGRYRTALIGAERDLAAANEQIAALKAEAERNAKDAERYRSRTIVGWIDGYMIGLPEDAKKHPNAKPVFVFDAAIEGSAK